MTGYDYEKQCWVVDGRVARCGHRELMPGCYACVHHGEPCPQPTIDDETERAESIATAKAQGFRFGGYINR